MRNLVCNNSPIGGFNLFATFGAFAMFFPPFLHSHYLTSVLFLSILHLDATSIWGFQAPLKVSMGASWMRNPNPMHLETRYIGAAFPRSSNLLRSHYCIKADHVVDTSHSPAVPAYYPSHAEYVHFSLPFLFQPTYHTPLCHFKSLSSECVSLENGRKKISRNQSRNERIQKPTQWTPYPHLPSLLLHLHHHHSLQSLPLLSFQKVPCRPPELPSSFTLSTGTLPNVRLFHASFSLLQLMAFPCSRRGCQDRCQQRWR